MVAPLNTCTTIEQRGVVRFLRAKNMDAAKDIHKEMLPIWAALLIELLSYITAHRTRETCFIREGSSIKRSFGIFHVYSAVHRDIFI
jgi:hypothetical protein